MLDPLAILREERDAAKANLASWESQPKTPERNAVCSEMRAVIRALEKILARC